MKQNVLPIANVDTKRRISLSWNIRLPSDCLSSLEGCPQYFAASSIMTDLSQHVALV